MIMLDLEPHTGYHPPLVDEAWAVLRVHTPNPERAKRAQGCLIMGNLDGTRLPMIITEASKPRIPLERVR